MENSRLGLSLLARWVYGSTNVQTCVCLDYLDYMYMYVSIFGASMLSSRQCCLELSDNAYNIK